MGFFKKIGEKFADGLLKSMLKSSGVESLNPYIGMLLKAGPSDLIADEKFRLSMVLREGTYGVFKDFNRAKELCRLAAEEGHPPAMVMYVQYIMTKPDESNPDILRWLEKASLEGEYQALYNVGISYHRGDFGIPNFKKSYDCFRKAALRKYGPAYTRLAIIHHNGEEYIKSNKAIAKFFAAMGHELRDAEATQILMALATDEEKEKGVLNLNNILKEASEAGEKLATYRIVWDKLKNKEVDIDTAIEKILPLLSENEDLIMHEGLGYLYCRKGMYETALPYLTKAAEAGFDDSQTLLADIFYKGRVGDKDINKAFDWIIKAVNFGNKQARSLFAYMIMNNDLQEILPDKVFRGQSYLELANIPS